MKRNINIIVCWIRPNGSYYYRFVSGYYKHYYVGYENQYHHKVVLIIKNPYLKQRQLSLKPYVKNMVYKIYCKI